MEYCERRTILRDGVGIFIRRWEPVAASHGTVLLVHGLGEHTARHQYSAEFLAGRGHRVVAFDLRGHGRSDGHPGHVADYSMLVDDLDEIVRSLPEGGGPVFCYGHSMGAQLVINHLLTGRAPFRGVVLSAPWLRLRMRPHPVKLLVARWAARHWPTLAFPTGLRRNDLALDPQIEVSAEEEALVHKKITAGMFAEVTAGAGRALAGATAVTAPFFLLHGGDDPVIAVSGSEELYDHAGSRDKTFKIYPGLRHEPHNERDRDTVLADIAGWIEARCLGDA